jgi:glycosyltransferase involved in cell wall biosynthesis
MAHLTRAEVLHALSTRRSAPPAPGDPRLSVVIPAYREAPAIGATIARVRAELATVAADGGLEVVVVDDGSGDGTADAARAAGADHVLAFPANRGKGAAVRAGMLAATGRTRVFTDADLSYAPAQIERLLVEVEAGWDVVVGNRHHHGSTTLVAAGALRQVGGRVINLATRTVLVGPHEDTQCGLKAFRSDVARVIFDHSHVDGFAFDVEVIHLVERYGLSLSEVEVEVANSDRSTVHVARDALRLLADLARIRRRSSRGGYDLEPEERRALGLGHLRSGE